MEKRLFLLDGMALAYRAHFAFIARPIRTSTGVNTSALYGFASTLLDLIQNQNPTHMAVVFDTAEPTERHKLYPEYKANRDEMPEDLSAALPHLRRFAEAFGIPVLTRDGYEADDIIGTLATQAAPSGFETYMVTPDKDFGQLVSDRIFIYKPGARGEGHETLGVKEVLERWGIERVEQVIDMLALIGDASDNIPGVPGIGPKTATRLISQFGSLEELLARTGELKGKLREKLEQYADQARLSKTLATIDCNVPLDVSPDALGFTTPDMAALRDLFAEFEFRSLAKRALGAAAANASAPGQQGDLFPETMPSQDRPRTGSEHGQLDLGVVKQHRTIADVAHSYRHITDLAGVTDILPQLSEAKAFCFDTETDGIEPRKAALVGISLAWKPHEACFIRLPGSRSLETLDALRPIFLDTTVLKIGHNLKFDLAVLKAHGIEAAGPFFDTMLAHALVEPEQRHGMDYLSEVLLDYTPIPLSRLMGEGEKKVSIPAIEPEVLAEYAAEDADVTLQLYHAIRPMLEEKNQVKVFEEVEMPLVKVLVDMEHEGIALDVQTLQTFGKTLEEQAETLQREVFKMAGREFNLNSPKQLGEILFDELQLIEKPKKTRTGQYATNEQTLQTLANLHPIIPAILRYRETVKLKSTYVDALPAAVDPDTGRIHTHFGQLRTTTGRLNSDNPNLQNIPIRTEQGREIRRAFVARSPEWKLLSADYSQIELRVIAALSKDPGMMEAFERGDDIHTATAARIYGVPASEVDREMRSRAKMVNFGIPYGISPFGLAQRLGISRSEAGALIDEYFAQFGGIRQYIESTLEFARKNGYVETVTGRRRYLPDINSANGATRASAERNAINMPIQGTAADMIKIAMSRIHKEMIRADLRSRLLLQVHDELLFEVHHTEQATVAKIAEQHMREALPLAVPIVVEIGVGANWLEAH